MEGLASNSRPRLGLELLESLRVERPSTFSKKRREPVGVREARGVVVEFRSRRAVQEDTAMGDYCHRTG